LVDSKGSGGEGIRKQVDTNWSSHILCGKRVGARVMGTALLEQRLGKNGSNCWNSKGGIGGEGRKFKAGAPAVR